MSVFLNNVDDFILPSQACINPLVLQKAASTSESTTTKTKVENKVKNVLSIDSTQSEFERVKEVKPDLIKSSFSSSSGAKVATVSLNDCLACRYKLSTIICIPSQNYVINLNNITISYSVVDV